MKNHAQNLMEKLAADSFIKNWNWIISRSLVWNIIKNVFIVCPSGDTNISRTRKAFNIKRKTSVIIFIGLPAVKNCLRPESVPLKCWFLYMLQIFDFRMLRYQRLTLSLQTYSRAQINRLSGIFAQKNDWFGWNKRCGWNFCSK